MRQLFVKYYQPSNRELWNQFVKKSPYATFLFHRDFMEYHQDRFVEASLLIYHQEDLIALLPAHQVNQDFFVHKGLSYGSLILQKHEIKKKC